MLTKTATTLSASVFSYCVFINTENAEAFTQIRTPIAAITSSSSLPAVNANHRSSGCACPKCVNGQGDNCSCACRAAAHSQACMCSECSGSHGVGCPCVACSRAKHGVGCECASCQL